MSADAADGSGPGTTVEVNDFHVDGVRVLHFPEDSGRTDASLIFGVGVRDETLATLGTLHALEHVVMSGVRRTPIDINASVGINTTQFTAEGSAEHAGAFLTGVCRGLAAPAVERLKQEAKVLEAEADGAGDGVSPAAVFRYGFQGLGIVGGPGPGPTGVRAEAVRDAAARWFMAANALLVVRGAMPEGLHLPLMSGARPAHTVVPPRHVTQPSAVTVEAPVCELNLLLPTQSAALTRLAITVLDQRLTEVLRHDRGLIYTLDVDPVPLPDGFDLTIHADPSPGRIRDCTHGMVETVRTLLADGPTDTEVEHATAILRESLQGRSSEIETLADLAIDELLGFQDSSIGPGFVCPNRDEVTAYLHQVGTDLIYVVDESVEEELPALKLAVIEPGSTSTSDLPAGEVFRPPLLALALTKEARASRVILTSTGLAYSYDGTVQQLAWSDVVGVMRDEDQILNVFGRDGQAISIGPSLYKKGQRLIDVTLANVPSNLIYDAPPEIDSDPADDRFVSRPG